MANRDMLAEAIADAKALKETAIANAKAALEEAFEPRLKSMLSAKLQEMEDLDEAEDEMTEAKKKYRDDDRKDGGESKETKRTEKMKYGKDLAEAEEIDEEMDLDEILAELDEAEDSDDVNEAEDMEKVDEAEEEEEIEVDVDAEESEDEDEDIDLEEMSEEDLKSFIEDVIRDMVGSGELEAGEEFEVEDDVEVEDEEDIDIDAEDEVEVDEIMEEEVTEEEEDKMDEIMAEVNALKAELQEVNLLNAKLLYTNKIFRAKNLSEAKKVKVLEAFDKASSVKEVKLVFETLNESIKETPKTIVKESLGSASKPAGVAAKAPIVEVDPQVARWQKLAGLR
jgi:hypothetical protein